MNTVNTDITLAVVDATLDDYEDFTVSDDAMRWRPESPGQADVPDSFTWGAGVPEWTDLTLARDVREALYVCARLSRSSEETVQRWSHHARRVGNPQILLIHAYAALCDAQLLIMRADEAAAGRDADALAGAINAVQAVLEQVHKAARGTARTARAAAKTERAGS